MTLKGSCPNPHTTPQRWPTLSPSPGQGCRSPKPLPGLLLGQRAVQGPLPSGGLPHRKPCCSYIYQPAMHANFASFGCGGRSIWLYLPANNACKVCFFGVHWAVRTAYRLTGLCSPCLMLQSWVIRRQHVQVETHLSEQRPLTIDALCTYYPLLCVVCV